MGVTQRNVTGLAVWKIIAVIALSMVRRSRYADEVNYAVPANLRDSEKWQAVFETASGQVETGTQVSTSSSEQETDAYLIVPTPPVRGSFALSGHLAGNSTSFHPFDDDVLVAASWLLEACVCVDRNCETTASVDILGARDVDKVGERGYAPLLGIPESSEGGAFVPCGSTWLGELHVLEVQGCTNQSVGETGFTKMEVNSCETGDVAALTIWDEQTGRLVARAINATEIIPSASRDVVGSNQTVAEVLDTTGTFDADLFGFDTSVAAVAEAASEFVMLSVVDQVGLAFLGSNFPAENPLSSATIADVLRVFFYISVKRLYRSVSVRIIHYCSLFRFKNEKFRDCHRTAVGVPNKHTSGVCKPKKALLYPNPF